MVRISRRTLVRGTTAASVTAIVGVAAPAIGQKRPKVVFASGLDPTFAHYVAAVRKGFLEKRGIEGEIRAFDDGNVALDALLTGQGDIGGTSELAGIARIARGGKMYVVASGAYGKAILGAVDRGQIKQPKDLEGRIVGTPRGSGSHFWLLKYMDYHKLDRSKVTIKFVSPPESVAAFARKDVDTYFAHEPWPSRIKAQVPEARVFARSGDDDIYVLNIYIYFGQRLMSDAALARSTLEGIVEATDWVRGNMDEAAKLAAEQYKTTPEEAKAIMQWPTYETLFPKGTDSVFKQVGEFAKNERIIQGIPDLKPFIDRDILRAIRPSAVG